MRRDLPVVAGLTVLAGVIAASGADQPVRVVAAVLLEFLLTGYALMVLVRTRVALSHSECALLMLAMSLVVAALGGLVLDVLPGHMGRVEWSALFVLVSVASVAAAAIIERRRARSHDADETVRGPRRRATGLPSLRTLLNTTLALFALGLAVAAVAIAQHAAARTPGFLALSAIPASNAHDPALRIQLSSHEPAAVPLRIVIREDGTLVLRRELRLAAGAEYRMSSRAVRPSTARVTVGVYRAGQTSAALRTIFYPPAPRAHSSRLVGVFARVHRARAGRGHGARR
jgi:hypothetical protein